MFRQTLARRTPSLSRFNTLQNPSSSSSQPLLLFSDQIISSHSPQLSSHSDKWGFRKFQSFQQFMPFSSDSITQPIQEPDLGVSDFNVDENEAESESLGMENEGDVDENDSIVVEEKDSTEESEEDQVIVENDVEEVEKLLSLLQSSGGDVEKKFKRRLDEMRLVLSEDFVVSILGTPNVPVGNFVSFYGWCLGKKRGLSRTKTLGTLVRVVCSELDKQSAYMLWDLMKGVGKKGVFDTEILNELICLFARIGEGNAVYEVFQKFEELGCVPDAETFYYTTEALCKRFMFDFAASVSKKMVNMEILPDAEKIGQLVYYLCKGKKARDAHSVYWLAKEKNKCPPRSSVDVLITSLCFLPSKDKTDKLYSENIYLALEMVDNFSDEDRKSAAFQPFSSVCQALCKIGDVDKAKGLLFSMIKSGPPPGSAVFNATINGLSKAGELEEAMKLLKVIEERGLKPDVSAYTAIINGYAEGGAMVEARQVLEEAKQRHVKLTPDTYHIMIRGYCKLEQFDEAVKLLPEMKEYGVQATADAYNKLIESLCLNVLDWEMAERLQEEMKEKGLHFNKRTRGLIRAVKELEAEGKETQEIEK